MKSLNIEIKWAFLFSLMTLLWMLLERLSGLHSTLIAQHATYTNLIAIPAIALYVFALQEKKKIAYDGQMGFQQGLISGLILTAMITALTPITQTITSKFITPDFFTNASNYAVQTKQLTAEAAAQYFNLQSYIVQGLIGAPVMGIITTLIVAFFVRSKK
jgi:hypothetical protein